MVIFDAGLFIILVGTAVISLFLSLKIGAVLLVLTIIIFFSMGIVMFAQNDVAYISEFYGAGGCTEAVPCVSTQYLITENHNWLGWIFTALGIFATLLFFFEMIGFFDPTKSSQESTF